MNEELRDRVAAALFAWMAGDDDFSYNVHRENLPSGRTPLAPFKDQDEQTIALFREGADVVLAAATEPLRAEGVSEKLRERLALRPTAADLARAAYYAAGNGEDDDDPEADGVPWEMLEAEERLPWFEDLANELRLALLAPEGAGEREADGWISAYDWTHGVAARRVEEARVQLEPFEAGDEHVPVFFGTPPSHPAPDLCQMPPAGWRCTRKPGHDGPCAAVPVEDGEWRDVDGVPGWQVHPSLDDAARELRGVAAHLAGDVFDFGPQIEALERIATKLRGAHPAPEPDAVRRALERLLYAHEEDFANDHDAAVQHGHEALNARVKRPASREAEREREADAWAYEVEGSGGWTITMVDVDRNALPSEAAGPIRTARHVPLYRRTPPSPPAPAACDHPFPWRIEHDWTAEIYDANGALVAKVLHAHGSDQARAVALAIQQHNPPKPGEPNIAIRPSHQAPEPERSIHLRERCRHGILLTAKCPDPYCAASREAEREEEPPGMVGLRPEWIGYDAESDRYRIMAPGLPHLFVHASHLPARHPEASPTEPEGER